MQRLVRSETSSEVLAAFLLGTGQDWQPPAATHVSISDSGPLAFDSSAQKASNPSALEQHGPRTSSRLARRARCFLRQVKACFGITFFEEVFRRRHAVGARVFEVAAKLFDARFALRRSCRTHTVFLLQRHALVHGEPATSDVRLGPHCSSGRPSPCLEKSGRLRRPGKLSV